MKGLGPMAETSLINHTGRSLELHPHKKHTRITEESQKKHRRITEEAQKKHRRSTEEAQKKHIRITRTQFTAITLLLPPKAKKRGPIGVSFYFLHCQSSKNSHKGSPVIKSSPVARKLVKRSPAIGRRPEN